jgi:hypothetical protein
VGDDRGGRFGSRPKSYSRWLRATLLANGVSLPLPLDVAQDVAEILIATGRTVEPTRWVGRILRAVAEAEAAMLPANMV